MSSGSRACIGLSDASPSARREGYSAALQDDGARSAVGPRIRKTIAIVSSLALAGALVVLALPPSQGPLRSNPQAAPGTSAMSSDAEGDAEPQRLWGLGSFGQDATKACGEAAGFFHLAFCMTSTLTSTTSTFTTTSTATGTTTTTTATTTTVTTTITSTSTESTTTTSRTSTTLTTTTLTTTPWLEAMKWVGCFERSSIAEMEDNVLNHTHNTLPRPYGYTSVSCARACASFRYLLLEDAGRCVCLGVHPKANTFHQVDAEQCGPPCETEEELLPKRRCGTKKAFAIYRVDSAAEVREEMEDGDRLGENQFGQDIWTGVAEASSLVSDKKDARRKAIMKGVSYGPVPLRDIGRLPDDDFMSESTKALWSSGEKARGDLAIIRSLGANTVRLYGNDPALDHSKFLDEAMKQGLQVVGGISDYPYTQMPGNCISTKFNCYTQVKEQYRQNLKRGFLSVGNAYHPALRTVILMNEPDLKFQGGPVSYCKAIISAFDAVLDAEREVGVAGQAPMLTTTFSFGVCGGGCKEHGTDPALGQMLELRRAMQDPESFGYKPNNDLWAAFKLRFINSVNTANPAGDIRWLFLDTYDLLFPSVPVFIGEYHSPRMVDQQRDLEAILDIARNESSMLMGISFFEFQVRYDKGGSEMAYGMFGLEDRIVTDMRIGWGPFSAYCLKPMEMSEIAGAIYKFPCGNVEVGVDYVTDSSWSVSLDHIAEPRFCCQRCKDEPKCLSWTWVEDAALKTPGSPAQCWLKGGVPTGKVPKDGVMSGVPNGIEDRIAQSIEEKEAFQRRLNQRQLRGSTGGGKDEDEEEDDEDTLFRFSQCGGEFWHGPTKCPKHFSCKKKTEWYSQCLPSDSAAEGNEVWQKAVAQDAPNVYVHMAVAKAFGGEGVTADQLCPAGGDDEAKVVSSSTSKAPKQSANPVKFHGCYIHAAGSEYIYANEQKGYTSESCLEACEAYTYALLHHSGRCSCANTAPELSMFSQVLPSQCDDVCEGEEDLIPARYCGGEQTFAIYEEVH